MWDMVDTMFYCCWCLCKIPLPRGIVLLKTICNYEEVCFKGHEIHLWDLFFDYD